MKTRELREIEAASTAQLSEFRFSVEEFGLVSNHAGMTERQMVIPEPGKTVPSHSWQTLDRNRSPSSLLGPTSQHSQLSKVS